jgi:hypothetical protein
MEVQFEREALFKEVWETPMRTLATKYGLSDNGLRDICHALAIPVPPRGHWAKRAAGHAVSAPTLLSSTGPTSYTFRTLQRESLLPPNKELIAWLSEQLAFEGDQANKVVVAPELIRPHPLVHKTAQALAEYRRKLEVSRKRAEAPPKPRDRWQPDFSGFSKPSWRDYVDKGYIELHGEVLPLRVSLEVTDRALRLWDALIKACINRKMNISLGKGRLLVSERGITVELRMSERLIRTVLPTKGMSDIDILFKRNIRHESSGELRIFVDGFGAEWKAEDDSKCKLEDRLNIVLSRIHSKVKLRLDREAEWAERDRLEQLARERRELERQALAEQQRLQEVERQRRADLVAEAENWKHVAVVRDYIDAVRRLATDTMLSYESKVALNAWIAWAEHAADAMDPLTSRVQITFRKPHKT